MEQVQAFLRYEHANEIMIGFGALLLIISALSIIRMGFKLAMWVIVACVGATSLSYGMRNSPYELPFPSTINQLQITDLSDLAGKNRDVLQFMCQKLDQVTE